MLAWRASATMGSNGRPNPPPRPWDTFDLEPPEEEAEFIDSLQDDEIGTTETNCADHDPE